MIKISDKEAGIIDHALTFFYESVQEGNIHLYGMKPYEISRLQKDLHKRMDDEQ